MPRESDKITFMRPTYPSFQLEDACNRIYPLIEKLWTTHIYSFCNVMNGAMLLMNFIFHFLSHFLVTLMI